jgi:hypothetical protein
MAFVLLLAAAGLVEDGSGGEVEDVGGVEGERRTVAR